jgi:hypothetical protein
MGSSGYGDSPQTGRNASSALSFERVFYFMERRGRRMKQNVKIFVASVLGLGLMVSPLPSWASSVTYQISVTIPAIIGFNLPPFEYERAKAEKKAETDVTTDAQNIDTITEEVMRDNQIVILKTIVAK